MNDLALIGPILAAMFAAATPLLLAALGELVVEKSGVLNLGVEGMMLVGAVCGFAVTVQTGSATAGFLVAALAGAATASLFAVLTLFLLANQVATGLALTLFGVGLSALIGQGFVGIPLDGLPKLYIPVLTDLPVVGQAVFGQDVMVYLAVAAVPLVHLFLYRTRAGLVLRAVGENHTAAHALGYKVLRIRFLAVLFGGAMAGLGGAFLSMDYTPMWAENMTSGRGWIALALVVFATWKPARAMLGAWLFGGVTILQLHVQGLGIDVPSQLLSMLPYLATVLVLVLISRDVARIRLNAPACLGKLFHPDA
ncbi:ABC transporter permease [Azospirillum sp. CT11-132]|uniref:ABC transporter permease n=1 Tax=unclassified Azospirillum TaxID=2630922 RepID=UPI000D618977|nr:MULTISPECIES: ABC transporter permease [unclassified Azospirillum]PWC66686.1 ABC transporter permease [Azospirillum sp. TSH7]PWC70549.1 ABC transporter permease [Azospirillum sp. TSH20]QCG96846.1 ABC transporter permease [Azospirillum sp. TSA2s]